MKKRTKDAGPLRELAARVGIIDEYKDQTGKETRRTSDETRIEILRILGIEIRNGADAQRALDELEAKERERLIPPVRVVRRTGSAALRLPVALPQSWRGRVSWELELEDESGERKRVKGRGRATAGRPLSIALSRTPEPGYHTIRLRLSAQKEHREGEQMLVVAPPSCPTPDELHGGRRMMGVIAQLYTVRSPRNWGIGDAEDLARLLVWSAQGGADFVGVNPLHALLDRGKDISPYSPVSRVYRNPIYIAPELVPAVAASPEAWALVASDEVQAMLAALRAADSVDYEHVMTLKHRVLRAAHGAWQREQRSPRRRAYERYLAEQGEQLERFATYLALDEHFHSSGKSDGFRSWPAEYRSATSPAVRRFAESHADDVDYHRWLQFELDAQLADAASRAADAGMAIGLYQDLAIGTSPTSSDVWSYPELFVQGASIGAPPDPYSATGQNWGLPPLDPRRLQDDRHAYWISIVRACLRHAGALRIDHVMGLFRQFWIPEGRTGKEGAYVRFPSEDLLGILALESSRANALVVGEDLGTVPDDVPPALDRWGILSSKVLYFEREGRGGFKPSRRYAPLSLATANTHDMATLAAFWTGQDLDIRERVGLADAGETKKAKRERERDKAALIERLEAEGLLRLDDGEEPDPAEFRGAVHAFLARSPSALVGLSLDDLAGEIDPVNVPGVGPDEYPSWTRRMHLALEELPFDEAVASALRAGRRES